MTVASTTNRKSFSGDGVTTSFGTSPVVFYESTDLVVEVFSSAGVATTLTEGTQYTVSGGSTTGATGTVNLAGGSSPYGAPAVGDTLLIRRVLPLVQEADFVNNDINDAEVSETALDKLTMIAQQQDEDLGRAIKVAAAEGEQDPIVVTGKAGYYLRRNIAGTAFELAVGDANTSTFTQSGTGAVERSVTSKLGETVSVKDFGAAGDGVTDDTAAIQAALDAVSALGGCVRFPLPGKYLITSQITVTSSNAVSLVSEMGPNNTASPEGYIVIGAAISGSAFDITARGGVVRGLWFRDPTSVLGVSQGTRAVNAALKLTTFGMGRVEDCAFDGVLGSAIEVDGMIRGHIVRPHIRDCGTPTKPALWLNPQTALGAGQITINAPHIETCYGEYLRIGSNAVDTKVIGGQFEADTNIAGTCKNFIYNSGDRTVVSASGFNRNTVAAFYGAGNRAIVDSCHFNHASGVASDPQIYLAGSLNQISNCRVHGTAATVGTSIQDVGGNNLFTGCFVYFGGNVILGSNTVWNGGGCFDAQTTQTYCIEGATNSSVVGAHVSGADVAGGIKAIGGMVVSGCNVYLNAGIGIRNESSTTTIVGNRATGNTGGNYSFTAYPHGYSPNSNFSGDGVYPLQASQTWNPGSLANGASESLNVTVTGAAVGDTAIAQFPMIAGGGGQNGMQISASVYTNNAVKVTISNVSGGVVDLDSGTVVVKVTKQ